MENQEVLNTIAILNVTLDTFSKSRFTDQESDKEVVDKILDLIKKL